MTKNSAYKISSSLQMFKEDLPRALYTSCYDFSAFFLTSRLTHVVNSH